MAGGDLSERVSVRARFERFPMTVKGAFILRGEDSDPHQVELRGGAVVGIGTSTRVAMPLAPASLDVVPHRDVFVPFEVPLSELDPGWYTLEAELEVEQDEGSGRTKVTTYPVMRTHDRVTLDLRGGKASATVEVPLPR